MKRIFITLFAFVFSTGVVVKSKAQGSQQKGNTILKASVLLDSSLVSSISLTPAKEKVRYAANNYSTPFQYASLKPQESLFSDMHVSLSGDEKTDLKKYIQKYFRANGRHFQKIHAKSSHYFSTITKVFAQYGVPEDLKYLAVIESNLNTHARSYVGAVGAWQFMASTARLLGLTVNAHRDDRKDLYKSTVAAAKYLSELHHTFNNWILVVAAYNSGPGRVKSAISSSKSDRFWDLKKYLPHESQNHVMKFLATAYIMNRFAHFFGVEGTSNSFRFHVKSNQPLQTSKDLASISLSGKYSLAIIAQYTSMNLKTLQRLNPKITERLSDSSKEHTVLYLPADKMINFKAHQSEILNRSIDLFMKDKSL